MATELFGKYLTSCRKSAILVDNLGQAVRTQLADGLLANLLQDVRLLCRQHVVFALLVPSCHQVWNKMLATCNNLVNIIRLVARLFQQYSHDITLLLQPCTVEHFCYIMTVSDLLEQPCYKSDNAIISLLQVVNSLFQTC
jgi:hypothetical protein